jgi:hypothetical protein
MIEHETSWETYVRDSTYGPVMLPASRRG